MKNNLNSQYSKYFIRYVVMNYSSGISMEFYRSYWYQIKFLFRFFGKLQDIGINLKRSHKNLIHGR
jgi:hypothetical protein